MHLFAYPLYILLRLFNQLLVAAFFAFSLLQQIIHRFFLILGVAAGGSNVSSDCGLAGSSACW